MNDLTELVELLSRQRLLLERMLYRVVSLRLLVVGGQARFISWASDELEDAARAVAAAELRRSALYASLAGAHHLPEEFNLEALAALAAEPHKTMLTTLRADLAELTAELRHNIAVVREAAHDGHTSASEVLARLRGLDPTAAIAPAGNPGHVDARL